MASRVGGGGHTGGGCHPATQYSTSALAEGAITWHLLSCCPQPVHLLSYCFPACPNNHIHTDLHLPSAAQDIDTYIHVHCFWHVVVLSI